MYPKAFLLKELSVYSKLIIFFIEIGVLKANGIKHNEYSIRFYKSVIGRTKTLNLTY